MAIILQSIFIFTVLLIFQTGRVKSDGISYEDNKYNLENGPVLYEAYYPDANVVDQSQNTSPNKLYQQIPVIEKSYQRPYSHNYQDQIIDDQQDYPEIINQHNNYQVNSQPIASYTNQQQQQQQKASLEEALNIIINAIRQKNIESHPVYKNYQVPLNFPPNEPRITESGKFVFPNENYRTYEKHGPVDDIYKARAHLFNPTKQPQNIQSFIGNNNNNNNENEKRMSLFENNLTQMKEINVDKPQVASIQVSQQQQKQQQHKHRHHHGENIQSNYQRPLTSI
ncbi:hypothetical protein HCN44_011097 [Aphidius gifuensis]|uniref:Uncharacterized protein n=1 Tax=Aphidius gifuensis TaxID=684658 RepID=A0A835CTZ7_APHGI|nr:GATA zinc finger domain-containing protein 10-like [Aphidius gifuensis]KAF7993828.1 hypothetical protein HCN44_011097 [Aphidius gifuensis]